MYRRLNIFLIIGAVFTLWYRHSVALVYEWSGESLFVGIFSPINESVWEHLSIFSLCLFGFLLGYFYFWKKIQNHSFCSYWHSFRYDSYSNVVYTYTVLLKINSFLDILSFISVCVAFFITAHLIENYNIPYLTPKLGFLIWDIIFALFIIFTLYQPDFQLFISY